MKYSGYVTFCLPDVENLCKQTIEVLTVNGKAAVVVQDAETYEKMSALAEYAEYVFFTKLSDQLPIGFMSIKLPGFQKT